MNSIFLVASTKIKSSKSKPTNSTNNTPSSSDTTNGKTSTPKVSSESHHRPTSTSSSSTSSRRSSSTHNPNKSSTSSKTIQNSTSTKTPTTTDSTVLDPLAFAASGGLTFPYFLPSLLSQSTSTNTTNPSTNSTANYPFSSLSSSLLNPAATLYPFLSPDWFTSPSKFMDGFGNNLTSDKSNGNLILQIFV